MTHILDRQRISEYVRGLREGSKREHSGVIACLSQLSPDEVERLGAVLVLLCDSVKQTDTSKSKRGLRDLVQQVIDVRPEWIEATDTSDRTPLMMAFERGHEEVASLLLERGANITHILPSGKIAARSLIIGHSSDDFKLSTTHDFLARNLLDQDRKTEMIIQAAYFGHEALCKLLIDHGADGCFLEDDKSPVMHMVALSDINALNLLWKTGADFSLVDKNGSNALHRLAHVPLTKIKNPHSEAIVRLLVEAGCDPYQQNKDGMAPFDVAQQNSAVAILPALIPFMEKRALSTQTPNARGGGRSLRL